MNYVYHGSSIPNLEVIKKHKSTHMKEWVYACHSKVVATIFLSPMHSDLFYSLSGDGKDYPVELVERKPGMFKKIFNCSGYIYKLDASNFKENQTGWSAEVVSDTDEKVISSEYIDNKLYIIIGAKAAKTFFPDEDYNNLIFKNNTLFGKLAIVLPHPSPLNIKWFKDNPDFMEKRIIEIRKIINNTLNKD